MSELVGHDTLLTMAGRRLEPFQEPWRLTLDPFGEGFRQNWPAFDETPPAQWITPRDYDVAGGAIVPVPSCWNVLRPDWRLYEGLAWYTTAFVWAPRLPAERAVLWIGAANYAAEVFLNGRSLARHRGGSTPFCVELTGTLRAGKNRLQIAVDNTRRPDRVPGEVFDWFNYGGLYREVGLVRLPPVFVRDAAIALVPDGSLFTIRAEVELSDPVEGAARVAIPELGLLLDVPIERGRGTAIGAANPALWSPARPKLYRVETRFGDDLVADRIGFREIRVEGEDILLNGRPVFLRGICVHEDDAASGKLLTDEDLRRRFAHARELDCNFLRLAHYPHHEKVARLADELGFLLWEEVPVYWGLDFAGPETYRDAENQLSELIRRDRNRASVAFWSVANETPDTDERLAFLTRLAAAARERDQTRPVTAACLLRDGRIADRLGAALDVIGINEYFGWYDPDLAGLERAFAGPGPGKPVIVSETGADALAGLRAGGRVLSTEDWQAEVYRRQFEILGRSPFVKGVSPWILYDFRSERRQSAVQRGFNRKGLLAEDKTTKKLAFPVLRDIYAKLAAERG